MIFGDVVGLKFPDTCLAGNEKTVLRKSVPTGDRTRTRCVTGAQAGVDRNLHIKINLKISISKTKTPLGLKICLHFISKVLEYTVENNKNSDN